MSRLPSQQCGPSSSDQRYLNQIRQTSYTEYHGGSASSNPSYPTRELPRFLYPDNHGYDPTIVTRPLDSLCSWQGNQQNSDADRRYSIYGNYVNTNPQVQYGLQRTSPMSIQQYAPGSAEHFNYHSSHQDVPNPMLGYGRGSVGSGGWSNDVDSQYSGSSAAIPSPVNSDHSMASFVGSNAMPKPQYQQQQQRQRSTDCSAIMGIDQILHHSPAPPAPRRPASTPSRSRYHLHIRQQPIAARACGAGDRDRRPVDPPPIVQMLLSDFNPSDVDILQDPRFTVGCLLFPAVPQSFVSVPSERNTTNSWESRASGINRSDHDSGNLPGQSTPLLSGKAFISPFYVDADPDPSTAPAHPSSGSSYTADTNTGPQPDAKIPSTFFIFSDLPVRTAGLYRLQFRLMNWGSVEDTGQSMPILAEAWSEPFRVYPAKDFPGMRDSSPLAEGLKELGFVELKTRGKGKGKGRRR